MGERVDDPISKALEFGQILIDGTALLDFEERPIWIIVIRGGKYGFQSLQHCGPRSQKTVPGHPLVPAKRRALHVEGGDRETVSIADALIIEELLDFENPAEGVLTVETRDIEFHVWTRIE